MGVPQLHSHTYRHSPLHCSQSTGRPRLLCITAKRRKDKSGFQGVLHIMKGGQGRFVVRKAVKLRFLTQVVFFVCVCVWEGGGGHCSYSLNA